MPMLLRWQFRNVFGPHNVSLYPFATLYAQPLCRSLLLLPRNHHDRAA